MNDKKSENIESEKQEPEVDMQKVLQAAGELKYMLKDAMIGLEESSPSYAMYQEAIEKAEEAGI